MFGRLDNRATFPVLYFVVHVLLSCLFCNAIMQLCKIQYVYISWPAKEACVMEQFVQCPLYSYKSKDAAARRWSERTYGDREKRMVQGHF